ncbi:hypothetical protein [Bacillus sp. FJAT-45350]|uniref:hypothetical protein n=1 Tax=Bacillus sp. FJAT-45350 TaxID=2011014 RepID=UPI000BB68742|nr:hypothetical protein [Bacillus sp. FJAT-45350]
MTKCNKCGSFDSYIENYYVDRNNNYFSKSELDAFHILHPDTEGNVEFKKVLICGMCSMELGYMTSK